ncbi:hypothetical protein ACA29_11720 [Lederbergia galactosidilytica]|uniref:Uncharacterized protein n=1 Tax=Lederbergia galactosidilytica TaxID=217031 RepID=A0A0Q9XUX8_9BACI|nr:hypothetical protein ACA29_11720 [Lederbergia galactosidilytica]
MPDDVQHKKIIQLIKHLPEATDPRTKEEIYHNLKHNMEKKPNRKKRLIVIPALSSLAVILIFLLISPTLFQKATYDETPITSRQEANIFSDSAESAKESKNKAIESNENSTTMQTEDKTEHASLRTALYKEDVDNKTVLTYASLTNDEGLVPVSVSILVSKEESEWFEQYKKGAEIIEKEAPNLMNIIPILNSIKIENPTNARVIIDDY